MKRVKRVQFAVKYQSADGTTLVVTKIADDHVSEPDWSRTFLYTKFTLPQSRHR